MNSGRWPAGSSAGSAGSSSPGCRRAAPTQPVRDSVASVGPRLGRPWCRDERIAVVRNGLDEAPRDVARRSAGGDAEGPGAVTPGAAQADRGRHWPLSRSCAHRCPTCISTSSEAGGGTQQLIDHAHRLGIGDAVTFHGHVDDNAKHHVMQQAWVHLLPSRKEGWGLAVIEAAQHAVPTIGYRSSGGLTDSIIDGVTGLLVDDHADLVNRLEQLLTDPVLRDQLGVKAQARSAEFSWKQTADGMRSVLESMVAGTASPAWSDSRQAAGLERPLAAPRARAPRYGHSPGPRAQTADAPPTSIASQARCATSTTARRAAERRQCRRRRDRASDLALDARPAVAPMSLWPCPCRRAYPTRRPASPRRPRAADPGRRRPAVAVACHGPFAFA